MTFLTASYQAILKYLVWGEVKIKYKNRVLGAAWAVLDPLMLMLIYLVLIKFIFQRGGPNYAVELLTGLITYRWFSTSVVTASRSLLSNGKLLQTVKFPYSVLPLSRVIINGVDFIIGLIILFVFVLFYQITPTLQWAWLPVLIVLEFQFILAAALIVSIVGIYFRDLLNILQFGVRILLYMSPILYGLEQLPEKFHSAYMALSPLSGLIISYKNVLIHGEMPSVYMFVFIALSLVLWSIALYLYKTRKNISKDL